MTLDYFSTLGHLTQRAGVAAILAQATCPRFAQRQGCHTATRGAIRQRTPSAQQPFLQLGPVGTGEHLSNGALRRGKELGLWDAEAKRSGWHGVRSGKGELQVVGQQERHAQA